MNEMMKTKVVLNPTGRFKMSAELCAEMEKRGSQYVSVRPDGGYDWDRNIPRHDPLLVQVVEAFTMRDFLGRIYCGNLPLHAYEDDVRELFASFGDVVSVHMVMDGETGRPRGFAFVEMASDEAAHKAIQVLDGQRHLERNLKVNEAQRTWREKRDRSESGILCGLEVEEIQGSIYRIETRRALYKWEAVTVGDTSPVRETNYTEEEYEAVVAFSPPESWVNAAEREDK